MRKTLKAGFLLALTLAVTGCGDTRSEGRASAILDASRPLAKAHASALADGTREEAEDTGARLLSVLACWWSECTP